MGGTGRGHCRAVCVFEGKLALMRVARLGPQYGERELRGAVMGTHVKTVRLEHQNSVLSIDFIEIKNLTIAGSDAPERGASATCARAAAEARALALRTGLI
ncbi:hypothetical protein HWV62_45412 [Athelia sp. TMB]|nr:hypothetical protein HWV62_45412 [Athelia sp. TMB]